MQQMLFTLHPFNPVSLVGCYQYLPNKAPLWDEAKADAIEHPLPGIMRNVFSEVEDI